MVKQGDFLEIYCDTPIEICETRDIKGLYKKARAGQIAEFTGISSLYQVPGNPARTVNTGAASLDACVQQVSGEITNRSVCALQLDPMPESESKKYCQGSGAQP
jgi:adenylylsulfate kinase